MPTGTIKISEFLLKAATTGDEYFPIVDAGENKRATLSTALAGYSPTGHTHANYITGFTESDPVFAAASGGFSTTGHTHDNYITGFTETDPIFAAASANFSTTGHNHTGTYQPILTFGIADTNAVKIDDAGAVTGEFARFASSGIEGYAASGVLYETIGLACSDETTDLAAASGVVYFRMPYAMTLMDARASVTTAPSGSTIAVDVNEGGSSIFSTTLMIDSNEKTSTTAATGFTFADTSLANDAEMRVDIDQVGSDIAGKGLKIFLVGYRT